jgi:hypothetical protein
MNQLHFKLPSGQSWLMLRLSTNPLAASGGPVPQIKLPLEARVLLPGVEGEVLRLAFDVRLGRGGDEVLIGHGEVGPISHLKNDEYPFSAPATCARQSLVHMLDLPNDGRVNLVLNFKGLLRLRHSNASQAALNQVGPPDVWHLLTAGDGQLHQLEVSFARSDWYEQVVKPMGLGDYLMAALRLPSARNVPAWEATLEHLAEARRALVAGDPPAVFGRCRAAIDALPGAKKGIFEGLPDDGRREEIDNLTKALGTYLHSGRHVVPGTGDIDPGRFPVDHRDAVLAYNTTSLMLSHIAGLTLEI